MIIAIATINKNIIDFKIVIKIIIVIFCVLTDFVI